MEIGNTKQQQKQLKQENGPNVSLKLAHYRENETWVELDDQEAVAWLVTNERDDDIPDDLKSVVQSALDASEI